MANRFLIDYTFFVAYKNFTLYPTPSSKKSFITVSLVPSISETIYQGEDSVLISVGFGLIVGITLNQQNYRAFTEDVIKSNLI